MYTKNQLSAEAQRELKTKSKWIGLGVLWCVAGSMLVLGGAQYFYRQYIDQKLPQHWEFLRTEEQLRWGLRQFEAELESFEQAQAELRARRNDPAVADWINRRLQKLQRSAERQGLATLVIGTGTAEWRRALAAEIERLEKNQGYKKAQLQQDFYKLERVFYGLLVVLMGFLVITVLVYRQIRSRLVWTVSLNKIIQKITLLDLGKELKAQLLSLRGQDENEFAHLAKSVGELVTAISEREKLLEEQKHRLEEQNRLLSEVNSQNRGILDQIESLIIVTDSHLSITKVNRSAELFLGQNEKDLMGSSLVALEVFQPLVQGGITLGRARTWQAFAAKEQVYRIKWAPFETAGEAAKGWILKLDRITEQLELEKRLRLAESFAMAGRLSAQVAHEVRNPLHSIGLETELALELVLKKDLSRIEPSLRSVLTSVERLEKITDNYLRFSRLSSGKKESVDVEHWLRQWIDSYRNLFELKRIEVLFRCGELKGRSVQIRIDIELFEQVFENLLQNSIQALEGQTSEEPRKIEIEIKLVNATALWLFYRDSGPGISPSIREQLFQPFVTTKASGTGLGLSYARSIIEQHGGELTLVDSSASAASVWGAQFRLLLPIQVNTQKKGNYGVHSISR